MDNLMLFVKKTLPWGRLAMSSGMFLFVLFVIAVARIADAKIDEDKAAEISREIREHFRLTGMNWVSPRMLQTLDLTTNTKPILYFFTWRSRLMDGLRLPGPSLMSQLSAQFLAVLVMDDDNYDFGPEYGTPNNEYVPRMLFASPKGKLNYDIVNPKADKDQAFMYLKSAEVVEAMQTALDWYRPTEELLYPSDLTADMPS